MSETSLQTHHRICPLCEACCGLEVQTQGDQVIRVRGHASDIFSHGYLCPKGVALKDLHEDPDRLRAPLIKRNGVFHEAGWDEAFAEIERRLPPLIAQHGRNAVGVVAGNPTSHKLGLMLYYPRLLKALGTRNIFSAATLDQMPRHVVSGLLYGHWMSVPVPDIARTDWLLVLGANPVASNGSMWTVPDFRGKARAMQARGGRLIVIDPRRSETAALADEHHVIRPGSDAFLLAGMLHHLFAKNLVTAGAATSLVDGLALLKDAVQPFTPARTALRCGVPAETIQRLATELASTPRAALYGRIGTCTQRFGTLSTWLIDVLNILTGHLDQPGGTMFPKAAAFAANTQGKPGQGRGVVTGRFATRVSQAPEVMGEVPITCLAEEIETPGEGQVRALITLATNPVLSSPNGARLARALDGLDFMVSMDIYLNETTRHADVILPGPSPLEDLHYDVPYPQMSWMNHARFSAPVFARAPGQPAECVFLDLVEVHVLVDLAPSLLITPMSARYSATVGMRPSLEQWRPARPSPGTRWCSCPGGWGSCGCWWTSRWRLRAPGPGCPCTASSRAFRCGHRRRRRRRSGLPWSARSASILVGGATHSLTGMSRLPSSSLDAARKWPMLVMHEPMKASSILVPATSDSELGVVRVVGAADDGLLDVGQVDLDHGGVLGVLVGFQQLGLGQPGFHLLDAALQVRVGIAVGDHVLHQHDVAELRYSLIGSLLSLTVQPAAERSAEASDSSNACSTFRSGRPSISRMRPEKMFFLPLGHGQQARLDGVQRNGVHQVAQRDAGLHLALEAHQHRFGHVQRHHAGGGAEGHQARAGREADADGEAGVRVAAGAHGVGQQQAVEPAVDHAVARAQRDAAAVADEGGQLAVGLHVHRLGVGGGVAEGLHHQVGAEAQAGQVLQLVAGHRAGGVLEPTVVILASQ
jgi:formylmethanofuran dehydrogenase subunit B